MSYIIGKACDGVCDTACVDACPVDCIHGPIDTEGCGEACVPECPVEAIHEDEEETIEIEGDDISVKKNYEFFNLTWKK